MIKRIRKKYIIIVMIAVVGVLGLIITAINVANYSSINDLLDEKLTMLVDYDGLMPPEDAFIEKPKEEEPPALEPETPGGGTETPGDGTETPGDGTEPPGDGTENPGDGTETPGDGTETPGDGTENPGDGTENPGDGTEIPGDGTQDTDGNETPGADVGNGEADQEEEPTPPYVHFGPETPYELRFFSVKLDTSGNLLDVYVDRISAVDSEEAVKYATDVFRSDKEKGYIGSYKYKTGQTEDGNLIYVFLDASRELKSYRIFLISSLVITAVGILAVLVLVILLSGTALKPIIESYEKRKRFITDAGHEMKTPLTVISANAEIIELESGESQWVTGIKHQVSKLASLTEKLVILSKMEEGVKLDMNEFSLSEAIFDTCDQYKSIALSAGTSFELSIAENVCIVGNENEIRRCISLLLDNAFRYVNKSGFVSIKLQNLVSGAEIKISNSTDGVEKGSLDNWFDRFYRRDLSRNSDTGGSGIGLSVVKAIVLAHGGSVKVHSHDGETVEFVINI